MLLNSENPKHKTADCGIPGYNLKVLAGTLISPTSWADDNVK